MGLSAMERKHRLEHGAQKRIAKKARVCESYVSGVVNDTAAPVRTEKGRKTLRRVQALIALELGVPVDEAFPVATAPAKAA